MQVGALLASTAIVSVGLCWALGSRRSANAGRTWEWHRTPKTSKLY